MQRRMANSMSKKFLAAVGVFIVLLVAGVVYLTSFNIHPTDEKIVDILLENEEDLLSIEGVVGAGIARNEDNHIIGIAVYVEDEAPSLSRYQIKWVNSRFLSRE